MLKIQSQISQAVTQVIERSGPYLLLKAATSNFCRKRMADNKMSTSHQAGWVELGKYSIFVRSIAGLETSVVVKNLDLMLAFDLGYAAKETVKCKSVFISHGHMDHISAVPQHAAKRSLFGMSQAKYYVPPHLVDDLKLICAGYYKMAETTMTDMNIIPCQFQDKIQISGNYTMSVFPTIHRVPSQGYILYHNSKTLKPEFKGLNGKVIADKVKQGENVHDVATTPEIAFTGDTTFEIFKTVSNPDLLKVKILIVEATYIDHTSKEDMVKTAQDRGHIHLQEFTDHSHLFKDIEHIILIHFSDKYSSNYIKRTVYSNLPDCLKEKVYVSTYAKEI